MSLVPGRDLSHYRLVERIGEGGMGVVWKATDTTLGRAVAIKVLPPAFADDPERMARFEREARLLAALNHPRVAAVYGVGQADGQRFLAMELVEGEDLAARLARGPLPLGEALELARGIAEGLEAAHEKGIIHRDLKPANVKLTADGHVKLLDFGLAKALDPEPDAGSRASNSMSPTLTSPMTAMNVILGTAAYMSPEQARGRAVDRRADIWAFGAVLYEMLTARRAFTGETVSETIAKVLEREPEWDALPPAIPARVRELLRRCLEKDPRRRLRDIGDARLELDELLAGGASDSAILARGGATIAGAASAGPTRAGSARLAWGLAIAAVAVASLAIAFPGAWRRPPRGTATRALIMSPPGMFVGDAPSDIALSPDGTQMVFAAYDSSRKGSLWLRPVDSFEAHPIAGSGFSAPEDAGMPFWSPDGKTIAFFSNGRLVTIPLTGGQPQVLASVTNPRGGTWSRDGTILYAPGSQGPLFRVSAAGGDPVQVTTLDTTRHETAHRFPQFLPDGRHFTFVAFSPELGHNSIEVGDLASGRRERLLEAESGVTFAPPGWLVYARGPSLVAQRFDPERRRLSGQPLRIGDAPRSSMLGQPMATAAGNGVLVYPTNAPIRSRLSWFDRDGRMLGDLAVPIADYRRVAISPDQRRIALSRSEPGSSQDVWIADARSGALSRLTTDGVEKQTLQWFRDNETLGFQKLPDGKNASEVVVVPPGGEPRTISVLRLGTVFCNVSQFAPDGATVMFDDLSRTTQRDLWYASMSGDPHPTCYLSTPFNEANGRLSPDGRWIAYQSDESGTTEIYVQSFPTPGHKVRISSDGGGTPFWRDDGAEILFPGSRGLMSAPIRTTGEPQVGPARLMFPWPRQTVAMCPAPDFGRILFVIAEDDASNSSLTMISDWPALLGK